MKSMNTMNAKDMLVSLASKLPENLLIDAVNEQGMFTASFLLRLKEEQLCDLRKAAREKREDFFLFFYSISEKNKGKQHATEVRNYTTFDFSKVVDVEFSSSTVNLLLYRDLAPVPYVSVTLVLKDEE